MAHRTPTGELRIDTTLLPLINALVVHEDVMRNLMRQVVSNELRGLSEFELQLLIGTVQSSSASLKEISAQITQRTRSQSLPPTPSNSQQAG